MKILWMLLFLNLAVGVALGQDEDGPIIISMTSKLTLSGELDALSKMGAAMKSLASEDLSCQEVTDCLVMPVRQPILSLSGKYLLTATSNPYLSVIKALKRERQALFELSELKNWPELSLLLPRPRCEQNTCTASYSDIFDDIFGEDNDKDDQEGNE